MYDIERYEGNYTFRKWRDCRSCGKPDGELSLPTGLPQSLGKVLSNFTTITWITAKAVIHITTRGYDDGFWNKKGLPTADKGF